MVQRTVSVPTWRPARKIAFAQVFLSLCSALSLAAAETSLWIRPTESDDALIWGRRDGIVFGIPSKHGMPGPRGLIRVGVYNDKTGKPELINFIAVEPVVHGPGPRVKG